MVNSLHFDDLLEHKLQELLNHPAVQAGLAPFLVALVTAELFRRMKLSGLVIIAGFAITVYLASNFSFSPLTASRKIVLLGLTSTLLALLLDLLKGRWIGFALALLGGAAAVWVVSRILQQQETQTMLLWGVGCASYTAVLVWSMDRMAQTPLRAASAATALGIATGGTALLAASGLLGQFGLALGAAAGAHLLIQTVSNTSLPTGRIFTLPFALIAGLTGCVAVLSAQLVWYVLPLLAAIPLAALLVPLPKRSVWIQSLLLNLVALALAGGAIYLTWRIAGGIPL